MTINKIKEASTLKVAVNGRVDTTTAPELEAELKPALGGITELILDFSQLNYISSAGLRVLLSLQKIMNAQGEMKVVGVNEVVYEIFEVTGFADILTIEKA
jgi:anti-sigma B factor antagonist